MQPEVKNDPKFLLIGIAPNVTEEFSRARFEEIKAAIGVVPGIAVSQYMANKLPVINDLQFEERIKNAVYSHEGIVFREKMNMNEQEHEEKERSELKKLTEIILRYDRYRKELFLPVQEIPLEYYFKNISVEEVLSKLNGLKSSDFGRVIQQLQKEGYIRPCSGSELHRALKEQLNYVPAVQVINQALRGDMPEPRRYHETE